MGQSQVYGTCGLPLVYWMVSGSMAAAGGFLFGVSYLIDSVFGSALWASGVVVGGGGILLGIAGGTIKLDAVRGKFEVE